MSERAFRRYKAASDVGMMVAIAKALFFNEFWKELQKSPKVKDLRPTDAEMIRRHLKEAIAAMNDNLFFFPPDVAGSERELKKVIENKLGDRNFRSRLLKELKERLDSESPTLFSFLGVE